MYLLNCKVPGHFLPLPEINLCTWIRNKVHPNRKRLRPLHLPTRTLPFGTKRNIIPLYQLNQDEFNHVACKEPTWTTMLAVTERKAIERYVDEVVLVFFAGDGAHLSIAEGIEFVERTLWESVAAPALWVGEGDESPFGEVDAGRES
jgi:hypothetical protein